MSLLKRNFHFHTNELRVDPEGRTYWFLKGLVNGRDIEIKDYNGTYHARIDNDDGKIKLSTDEGGLVGWILSILRR